MSDLIGGTVEIKQEDGSTLIIPTERSGHRVANMIVAAQIRHLIQQSLRSYQNKGMLATPKDLKDLAEAAKSLHQFSGDVYREDEGTPIAKPKQVQEDAAADEVSFDTPTKPEEKKA